MRKSRFSEEQIIAVLKAGRAGQKVADLCRKHGISEHTFHSWRAKYGGMELGDARKLRALEDENRRPKTGTGCATASRSTAPSAGRCWVSRPSVPGWYRRRARRAGSVDGRSGTVPGAQGFGSGLELNVHFHVLALDGVFAPRADET